MSITYEKNVTKSYIKRRRERGIEPTDAEIWQLIRSSWPGLTEEEHEAIFQACEKPR